MDVQIHLFRGAVCGSMPYLVMEIQRYECADSSVQKDGLRLMEIRRDMGVQIHLIRGAVCGRRTYLATAAMWMFRFICSEVRAAAAGRIWLRKCGNADVEMQLFRGAVCGRKPYLATEIWMSRLICSD